MSRFPAAVTTSGRALVRAIVAASAAVAVVLGAVTALAPPAGAQDAVGPCTAMATLSNGVVVNPYDPALEGTVYEIPIKGSAQYQGSVDADVSPPRPISGEVVISGPPGFGDITIDDTWVWDDPDATGVSDSGEVSWSLPSALPRGVELEVKGRHVDANGVVCEGRVLVTLEGGFFDSPLGYVALAGTLLAGAGLVASMFASGGGTTPPPATAWDPATQPGYPQQPGYPPQPPPASPQPPPASPQPPGAPPPGQPPPPPPGGAP